MAEGTRRKTTSSGKKSTSQTTKKPASTRRSPQSKGPSKTVTKREVYEEPADYTSVFIGLVILLALFVFLCNFGILGVVGRTVKGIMFGVFGFISYILPLVAVCMYMFRIFNRGNKVVTRRILAGILLCLLFMIASDLATGLVSQSPALDIHSIWDRCSADYKGGGVIGGAAAYYLVRSLSNVGTILFIIVAVIISLLIMAGRSFLEAVLEQGQLMYEDSREEHVSRHLDREERNKARNASKREKIRRKQELNEQRELDRRLKQEAKENDAILRMDNPSRGVTFNTTLESQTPTRSENADIRDDEHIIKVTDSDEYERNRDNSVLLHENVLSETTDAIHEITPFDEDEDHAGEYVSEPEEIYQSEPENVTEPTVPETVREIKPRRPVAKPREPEPVATREEPTVSRRNKPAGTVYKFPPISLLSPGKASNKSGGDKELKDTAELLIQTLETFGVKAKITDVSRGPAVTRYELQPELGVKVSKIVGLSDDLKLALAATDVRIEAPIPGKSAVGIEVPNKENEAVAFRELIESSTFKSSTASLPFAVGKDLGGQIIVHDIAKMPHVLIAGATGSGKSVCINTIIMSILYKCPPEDVRLIMIDPKIVELSVYNDIPHLLLPVVTDPKKAAGALAWAVHEMSDRYTKFADASVRDLKGYNAQLEDPAQKLPHILIIVDELADLMMVSPGEVEESICRLAQLARACGIHLVIATQRPSVDVITGLIKANMPSRIAFAVSSGVDSRTILDMVGAEKLLGKGDMLFYPQGLPKPVRVQGAFVSDSEVSKVVGFFKDLNYQVGGESIEDKVGEITKNSASGQDGNKGASDNGSDYDELFCEAGRFIIDKEKASIGALQRLLKIGFNRAARIMDQLADAGVVGEEQGTKPREILMDQAAFEQLIEELGLN